MIKKTKKSRLQKLPKIYRDNQEFVKIWNIYKTKIPKITPIWLLKRVLNDWIILLNCNHKTFMCQCVTCNKRFHYLDRKNIQWWHFIKSERSFRYRYDLNNIHPQCYTCNVLR